MWLWSWLRLYGALLHLYPASFRHEYGELMCRDVRRRLDGAPRAARLLIVLAACAEVLPNAFAEHASLLGQDLRFLARSLRQAPVFGATAVAVIALGIGATTAAFSVADFALLRPLPFAEPSRLVKVWESLPGYSLLEPSPANYRDWKRESRSFAGMGAYELDSANFVAPRRSGSLPERLSVAEVTADLFPLLGVSPRLGRPFAAADDRAGAPGTALLSDALWRRELGADPAAVGRRVLLDGAPYVVLGVMPPGFSFPRREVDLWVPMRFTERDFADRTDFRLEVVARLRKGVPLSRARAEMRLVAARLERQYPRENRQAGARVELLSDGLSESSRLLLLALSGAALCVLLVACANLASLLLARALARRAELAVRAALGAGRERLVRQLVTESLALAVAGGALGVAVAWAALPLLSRLVPVSLPLASAPAIDLRVLLFAALSTAATGLAFGAFPALRACREAELGGGVGHGGHGARAGFGRRERLRSAFVVAEVAAAVVLLVSAGLLLRALARIQATDPGFRASGAMTLRTALSSPKYDAVAARAAYYERVLREVRALPGVESAGFISFAPMLWRGGIWPVSLHGEPEERGSDHSVSLRYVTPGYFAALGVPLRAGRDVADGDRFDRPLVAVVSASFVRRFWPDIGPEGNPLGRRFQLAFHERTVVGVVGDVRVRGLERTSEPQVYLPYRQVEDGRLTFYAPKDLVLRATAPEPPERLLPAVRRIVRAIDPEQPISDVDTLEEVVANETAPRAVQARVLAAFAAIAFLLAGLGIYGLLSFAVSERAHEIGVRMALGAGAGEVLAMVLRQGALLALAGVVPGALLAYAAGRAMAALLAGLDPADWPTFAAAGALCLAATLLGSLWPARRAARVDPVRALKGE